MDKEIVTNIKGTIIVLNKLINRVPNGYNVVAFSLKIRPINSPINILASSIKEDL